MTLTLWWVKSALDTTYSIVLRNLGCHQTPQLILFSHPYFFWQSLVFSVVKSTNPRTIPTKTEIKKLTFHPWWDIWWRWEWWELYEQCQRQRMINTCQKVCNRSYQRKVDGVIGNGCNTWGPHVEQVVGTRESHQDKLPKLRELLHKLQTILLCVSWEFGLCHRQEDA